MVNMIAAVSNEGTFYRPVFVEEVLSWEGRSVFQRVPEKIGSVDLKKETWSRLHEGLRKVVEESTGRRAKVPWLEIGGKPFFGEGRVQLLKGIDQYGSINQAAKAAKIPYRRAWSYLHAMEKRLGIKLLNTRVGGTNGGGTELSKEAKEFLYGFEQVSAYLEKIVEKELPDFFIRSRYAI